jgi:hypothetical protein
MAKALGVVAIVALSVTVASTIVSICMQSMSAAQFLDLTKALLAWHVIAGGLAIGAAATFQTELKQLLNRVAR